MQEERLHREKYFHDQIFKEHSRRTLDKYYRIMETSFAAYESTLFSACGDRRVLEYGCGPEPRKIGQLAEKASSVVAIDLSEVAIEQAREAVRSETLENVDIRVMNAESLQFADSTFDVVCGTAIIHHLDLYKAFSEIARVLRPEGVAIFLEPMGHNPLINLYRKLTPHFRTDDEHPLRSEDLELTRSFFEVVSVRYFHLLTLAAVPFRNARFFPELLKRLDAGDRFLFRHLPLTRRYAWYTMITLKRPKQLPPNFG